MVYFLAYTSFLLLLPLQHILQNWLVPYTDIQNILNKTPHSLATAVRNYSDGTNMVCCEQILVLVHYVSHYWSDARLIVKLFCINILSFLINQETFCHMIFVIPCNLFIFLFFSHCMQNSMVVLPH